MDHRDYQTLLKAREQELQAQLETGKELAGAVVLDQSRVGRLSRMDAMQGQALNAEAQRRRRQELNRVRAALGRLNDDSYGDCLECGEPIASARLQHDPAATLCIDCARQR